MALVELGRFASGAEAAIVRGRLEADGIRTACFDSAMNIAESLGLMIPVRVMVDESDLEEARAIVAEAQAR